MYHQNILRSIRHYKMNPVIRALIISDFLVWSSYNLLSPFFAIFISDNIPNAKIEDIGIAAALYFIVKSIAEVPVGVYIDKTKSEKDDLFSALIGTAATAIVYFSYTFVNSISTLFLLQIVLGLAAALAFPGWYSIFTRHVDKGKEAFEWSLYDVFLGVGMAAAAALGGFILEAFGFDTLFTIVGLFTVFGALFLLSIKNRIYHRQRKSN